MMMQQNKQTKEKGITFKNWALLDDCISEINNTIVDNAKDLDNVKPMYNLKEYCHNYSEKS